MNSEVYVAAIWTYRLAYCKLRRGAQWRSFVVSSSAHFCKSKFFPEFVGIFSAVAKCSDCYHDYFVAFKVLEVDFYLAPFLCSLYGQQNYSVQTVLVSGPNGGQCQLLFFFRGGDGFFFLQFPFEYVHTNRLQGIVGLYVCVFMSQG